MQNEVQHQPGLNEIELKLRIAEVDSQAIFKHPSIQKNLVSPTQTRRLISVYYDTPTLQLLDAGISLRVRSMSGGWFQAVKSTGSSMAGLHQRMEWEDIISGPKPDFSKITEPNLAAIFADLELRQALKPIFTTDVSRTEWQLAYETSQIELALDIGKLIIHGQPDNTMTNETAISEIELELKQGKPSDVFTLAIALQHDIPLTLENTSKAEYGYAYFRSMPLTTPSPLSTSKPLENPWDCLQALQDALKHSNKDTPTVISSAIHRLSDLIASSVESEQKLLLSELEWLQELCEKNSMNAQLQVGINSQRYQGLLLRLAEWLLK